MKEVKDRRTDVYHDWVIGNGKARRLRWWNRWYWRRKAMRMPDA